MDIINSFNIPKESLIIITGGKSRSECLLLGTKAASGDIYLFLHADSILPENWADIVRNCLKSDIDVAVGAFSFKFMDSDLKLKIFLKVIQFFANVRSKWLQLPYGDQGLFMYKEVYEIIGGFPRQPILEDYDFILSARSLGKVHIVDESLETSARRWFVNGVIGNTLFNQVIFILK